MINKRRKRAARKQRLQELTVQKARPEAKTYLIWACPAGAADRLEGMEVYLQPPWAAPLAAPGRREDYRLG